jgi:hypothetical protein
VAHVYDTNYWEAEIKRIAGQGQSRQIFCKTLISKITSAKWIRDVAQVIEHLPSPEFKP